MPNFLKKFFLFLMNLAIVAALILIGWKFRQIYQDKHGSLDSLDDVPVELQKEISQAQKNFVENFPSKLSDGSLRTFIWQYAGKKYSVNQTLYASIYEFYQDQPKTYTYFNELPANWEEQYYGMFLAKNDKDDTIEQLLKAIRVQGLQNGLSEDELVELVVAFVQAIPYDEQKAANILNRSNDELISYPYEVLYNNKGVCSDKSFLAADLLRELGYGTAIFVFENENHMAVGVQCPMEYSNYSSGYCFVETTSNGAKIGIVPNLKAGVGQAADLEEIGSFDKNGSQNLQIKLTDVEIFQETSGQEYEGIIKTVEVNREIVALKAEINEMSAEIQQLKKEVESLEDYLKDKKETLEKYLEDGNIDKYNERVKVYNEKLEEYEDVIKDYNKKVGEFNEKVNRYNYLIKL